MSTECKPKVILLLQKSAPYRNSFVIVVGCFCLWGALIHLADLLSLRRDFSLLSTAWQWATIYLLFVDTMGAVGIFLKKAWGILFYVFAALPQTVGYIFIQSIFGSQPLLLFLHIFFLTGLLYFLAAEMVMEHGET